MGLIFLYIIIARKVSVTQSTTAICKLTYLQLDTTLLRAPNHLTVEEAQQIKDRERDEEKQRAG